MNLRTFSALLMSLSWCLAANGADGGQDEQQMARVVTLGITPWTAKNQMLEWSKPAIRHVETQSNVKIKPASANDMFGYFNRAKYKHFDAMVAPLHLALYLVKHHSYKPILIIENDARQLVVTLKANDVTSLDDFKSGVIWLPHPLTGGALFAKRELSKRSIRANIHHANDHWEVINALKTGKAKLGVVLDTILAKLDEKSREQFRVIHQHSASWEAMLVTPEGKHKEMFTIFEPLIGKSPTIDRKVVRSFDPVTEKRLQELFAKMAPYLDDMNVMLSKKQ